jgi:GNAT superfamily N-acetyltransferase/DNA-binding MarR family transcriptional regulator
MNFYEKIGKLAIGSRLRHLGDLITDDAAKIYELYGTRLQPRWFPVFYLLSVNKESTITEIANEIGHSHASVSQIVKEMVKHNIAREKKDKADGRKNVIVLSKLGLEVAEKIQEQYLDIDAAVEAALAETQHNLWKAIAEWEFLLERKSLYRRVYEQKKAREAAEVRIIDYAPEYQGDFKRLNEAWITRYFKMEEADHKSLDHPQEYILDKGGAIVLALYKDEIVGACALIKMDNDTYELAKMAVDPKAQGKSIGWLLGLAVKEKAKALGGRKLYLESNTKLTPAINLYHKLGFKKVAGQPSPYERCNIQMEVEI